MEDDSQNQGKEESRKPQHIRLPGFIVEGEIGLGEVIKRVTTAVGIRPCGGCMDRAKALDRRIVFASRRRS